MFYSEKDGIDIDGAWIDVNDPTSVSDLFTSARFCAYFRIKFCVYPCTDPFEQAVEQSLPPARITPPPDKTTPPFAVSNSSQLLTKRAPSFAYDHSGDNLFVPPYAIQNDAGGGNLSDRTVWVDSLHANGLIEYDTRKSIPFHPMLAATS
jgi:alpha-glucosidase